MAAALRNSDTFSGRRILAAERFYSAREIMELFSQAIGKKGVFRQVTPVEFRDLAPEGCGVEYMSTHLVIDEYGYFVGGKEELNESLKVVQGNPSSLVEYFTRMSNYYWS